MTMSYDGILVIDKPQGCTSHDVVAKLRRILSMKRIGHAGTLDPMATGVLPIFVGKATKAVSRMPGEKSYIAELALGITTDTQDCTGKVVSQSDERPTFSGMLEILPEFIGDITQIPPMYSAVSINGVRLYKLARQGIDVERKPRALHVSRLTLEPLDLDEFTLEVTCSSGGYVRTLIHDLGNKWGCGAVMTALRRTKAGPFDESHAHKLEDIAKAVNENTLDKILISPEMFI